MTTTETTEQPVKKQFIASAVCPACEAMDTIRMWTVDGTQYRDCIRCGFADSLNEFGQSVPLELPTRVNQDKPKVKKAAKPMQFFPNPKLKKQDDE
ncbi:YheV family putative zinc ribbon protein [Thiopseudomonas denitrificans]|uniref:Uncharacterized protein n=1 Tax=Thiopseudomonas denitrificans TaxID=1501432 RepID=A0A4R6TWJ5_9GAMM|nr:YheV family putative zinc ribbon protein [Thiopseudomonas denitrificans]TDQ38218.1 hypothetical protein DFQ45_105129 [Thiopseudomonas denitrificans]